MKTKTFRIVVLAVAMMWSAMAFAASSFAGEKEEKVQWDNVPGVVQKTITESIGTPLRC